MQKKYYYNALAHRLQVYPDKDHFRMFVGHCYIYQFGRARFLDDILKFYFKQFTQSEKEHLLKKYDEYMIVDLLGKWAEIKARGLTPERLNFLYDKVKYKKLMRLNIGFNEVDFKWPVMAKIFDHIITSSNVDELMPLMNELNPDLQQQIILFCKEVNEIKENYK